MPTLQQYYQDKAFCVLCSGNLIVTITAGEILTEHIKQVRRCVASMQSSLKHKELAGMHIINASRNRLVSPAVRAEVTLLATEARGGSTAIVLQGDSFAVTIVRSILSAVSILARTHTATRIFADVAEAIAWVGTLTQPPMTSVVSYNTIREVSLEYQNRIAGL